MDARYELQGTLKDIASYPRWAREMLAACQEAKQAVLDHPVWRMMHDATIDATTMRHFMIGVWPFIERFPGYMAHSLLKTRYGRSAGDDAARRWLVRNIRVEQNHAEYWLNWAEGAGIAREEVFHGAAPAGCRVLADWCEEVSRDGSLAAGLAATNYAIEGVTGEWAQYVYDSAAYQASFPLQSRTASLRWLQLHAAYDDAHPWEALDIVCTLLGAAPEPAEVEHLLECIRRSYVCMRQVGDSCLPQVGHGGSAGVAVVA
ncbi:MAG TPA: iron-containing redox enzyme family protein [Rhodanobacteraceae bacterium]|nr:iron-containing redox enzyme family protein [Rhodanobacteraceae bacterium]